MPTSCAELLGHLRRDETAPRVTYYDDADGPTRGERIELSAKVLANWAAKAGNLLQEEFDAGPGTRVALDLPAQHWRTLYWALACWSVGAAVVVDGPAEADVRVTDTPGDGPDQVVVTLAALARGGATSIPDGAFDEAAVLSTYDDHFDAWAQPDAADPALVSPAGRLTYAEVLPPLRDDPRRVWVTATSAHAVLRRALAVWADAGSILLVREPDAGAMDDRLRAEGAVRDSPGSPRRTE